MVSISGSREGISGQRSGLWVEMARIIREVRPKFVFVENSPAIT
ncbi:MAG: DNA cytosine methyltransferase [Nitrosomonas sp.]|nr:DNA cytosine methyltransferase [Nitrosomonas sp.]